MSSYQLVNLRCLRENIGWLRRFLRLTNESIEKDTQCAEASAAGMRLLSLQGWFDGVFCTQGILFMCTNSIFLKALITCLSISAII